MPKTRTAHDIPKRWPTDLGPVANTDTQLLIYGLFQKGRVLAQDGVADITYVPTWSGFLFLAVVLDAFSRRIIGWAMATHLRTSLVLAPSTWRCSNASPATSSIIRTRARSTRH